MKKLMITALTLTAAFALTAETYTPSTIPTGLSQSDVTPGEINYQGLLRDPSNGDEYVDGIYTIECRLYTQESGGSPIWGASYSVYVKKGYFNVMLGSAGATLNGTYGPTDLWKALWYKTGNRELYLGITLRQDPKGNALMSTSEIMPRQKLLTAPFAFRAQKAQYADAAPGNFKVAGNLDVSGNVTVANGKSLTLKNVTASDSEVKIGNSSSSPAKTTLQGSTVLVEAGTALNVNSHGNANISMDTGKKIYVTGGNIEANNVRTLFDASSQMNLSSPSIRGMGNLRWSYNEYPNANVNSYESPIWIKEVVVTVPANRLLASEYLWSLRPELGERVERYNWTVAGFKASTLSMDISQIYATTDDSGTKVVVGTTSSSANARTVTITMLGVIKQWSWSN